MRTPLPGCIVLGLLLISRSPGQTKPDTAAAPIGPWTHSLVTGLNVTQVSFSDWAQGGENSLAYAVSGIGKSAYENRFINWSFSYILAFGQTKFGSQGLRKMDDRIDFESVFTYKFGAYVNPYAAATMKTQFAKGYKYDNLGIATPLSKFFDPAYFTQSVGAGYQIIPQVKTRLGYGLREVYTNDFYAYTDDPNTPEHERVKINDGFESATDVQWKIDENIFLVSRLEIFLTVRRFDKAVLRSDNTLRVQVAKYISVSLSANVINDRQVSPYTQFMNTLAMGLNYTVF
jgi:hypothetical protein